MIALLGQRDAPTDALEDYCCLLGQAIARRGVSLQLVRMPWADIGWLRASQWLWKESRLWQAEWILIQYTALAWSRWGFPFGFLAVVGLLKSRGIKIAIVFHDPAPFGGARLRVPLKFPFSFIILDWQIYDGRNSCWQALAKAEMKFEKPPITRPRLVSEAA